MKKGFIGPIGDDLPSILAILLALGLFFSAVTFTLNIYNEKVGTVQMLKGSIEIGRVVLEQGLVTVINPPGASYVATSYGLKYDVYLDYASPEPTTANCPADNSYKFNYMVSVYDEIKGTILHTLTVRTCKG